jgi:hypothetical protein
MTESDKKVRDVFDAVKGVLEAVPIYQDTAQPAAREIGKALRTIAKTIHVALAPISALVWGYEQIQEFVSRRVAEKLRNTPLSAITTPAPAVAGPTLEALRYTGHDSTLRDMFANLLAASMDAATVSLAHPAFVEIIRQMAPDEARLVRYLSVKRPYPLITVRAARENAGAGGEIILHHFSLLGEDAACEHPSLTPGYLDNLRRLGIIEIPEFLKYTAPFAYDPLVQHPAVQTCLEEINAVQGQKALIERKGIAVTRFGRQFIAAAVVDHADLREVMNKES